MIKSNNDYWKKLGITRAIMETKSIKEIIKDRINFNFSFIDEKEIIISNEQCKMRKYIVFKEKNSDIFLKDFFGIDKIIDKSFSVIEVIRYLGDQKIYYQFVFNNTCIVSEKTIFYAVLLLDLEIYDPK